MALEAVVFSEGFFGCHAMAAEGGGGAWSRSSHGYGGMDGMMELDGSNAYCVDAGARSSAMTQGLEEPDSGSSVAVLPPGHGGGCGNADGALVGQEGAAAAAVTQAAGRRKRRRARRVKNREEVESQRMSHIAVERNRRKQMNEYLAVLRSLMPASYVQRGDQASIIGGAINYVKELEQLLQSLEAQRHERQECPVAPGDASAAVPFAGVFTFPQYSMSAGRSPTTANTASAVDDVSDVGGNADTGAEDSASKQSAVADIEVTMVESHANLKVLSRRRSRQLLRMVAGLQGHRLAVLHLNVASASHMALYSLSLKVEDDCQLSSVDDIATAVHRIVETIEQEGQQGCG